MIYLLRHGLDDENYVGGWSNSDLTEEGVNQVKEVSKFIKENLEISSIYSSDIKRAIATSNIIANELKIKPIYKNELRELDKGDLTGLNIKDALREYPEYFNNLDIYKKYPNGESMIDLYNRSKIILEKILKLDNSLIVTHRGVINMIYFILSNRLPDMNKKQFNVDYTSIHELDKLERKIRRIK